MAVLICAIHGPYQAELGSCPYCQRSSGKPTRPAALGSEDDLPTDPYGKLAAAVPSRRDWDTEGDDDQTQMPRRAGKHVSSGSEPVDEDATVVERPQSGLMGWLIVKSGGSYGHLYKIRTGAIIGRDMRKADVVIDDEKMSGLHAKINTKNGEFVLWDLGSSNGTFVNGQEIQGATVIKENDEIRMGNIVFVLKTLG